MAGPRITTESALMDYLDIRDAEGKEALLSRYLVAAEGLAERYARRRFSPGLRGGGDLDVDYTMSFTTRGRTLVRVPDLRSITTISHHGVVLTSADVDLGYRPSGDPTTQIELAVGLHRPIAMFGTVARIGGYELNDLVITGRWGFKPPPDEVAHAVCIIASKQWRRRDSGFADVTVDETTSYFRVAQAIPGEAKVMLDAYRAHNVGVISA